MKKTLLILICCVLLVCLSAVSSAEQLQVKKSATIERFTPQGVAKDIRQVAVRFSEQIVPFGELGLPDPFIVNCPVKGGGRWVDGKNWVYDFEKDLDAGIVCDFRLKDNVKSIKGYEIKGEKQFSFSTGGPAVKKIFPYADGEEVDEQQVFILALDGQADEESIIKNAYFIVDGIKEPFDIDILKGKEKEMLLKTYHKSYSPEKDRYEILIRAKRSFPNNVKIRFVWGKGIKTATGLSTTKEQFFNFKTRRPFTAFFDCRRENPKANCIPLLPMQVRFSSQVPVRFAGQITLKDSKKTYKPKIEEKANFVTNITFPGPFPEKSTLTVHIPRNIRDDAGRKLTNINKFPLRVKTDAYPPLAKFSSRFGIIEKDDAVLPVTIRNIEPNINGRMLDVTSMSISGRLQKIDTDVAVINWLKKVSSTGRTRSILKGEKKADAFSLPRISGTKDMEVIGIPLKDKGFYVVEIESQILGASLIGKNKTMFCPATALVTNLSAHLKWGRESSLIWVTSLDKGEPVRDAEVVIRDCMGGSIWQGKTDSQGIAFIDKKLPRQDELPQCEIKKDDDTYYDYQQLKPLSNINSGLFVFARTKDDMTFVHSSWNEGIEPYRFRLPQDFERSHIIAHTVFDRVLFRSGETVHMKHFLRRHTTGGIRYAEDQIPKKIRIQHMGSNEKYDLPIKWDAKKGQAESSWQIPKEAKLGNYYVTLITDEEDKKQKGRMMKPGYQSGEFRVEEFRVPLMKGVIKPLSDRIVNASEVDLDLMVEYLSGGSAKNLPVKLRTQIQPRYIYFEDYEDYSFSNGKVREGITKRSDDVETDPEEDEDREDRMRKQLKTLELTLGDGGSVRTKIDNIPLSTSPKDLLAELEYRDPNGEIQTISRRIPIYPSNVLIGIQMDTWGESKEVLKYRIQAVDLLGKPLSGLTVTSDIYKKTFYSHRKRLIGGFYSYEHVSEVKRIAAICSGKTDKKGMLFCEAKTPVTGSVIVDAKATDVSGNLSVAKMDTWIAGKDDMWFDVSDSDRIDLIPEKKRYEPGEVAIFQVRMPMREATALVTVEREGIIDSFVTRISGKNPVIKVLLKDSYAPNIFVSALCIRGRVKNIQPTALIDLGKPTYKLGIAEIAVGWKANELKVSVKADREIYKVREKADVRIKVKTVDGKQVPKGGEVAVAAIDEGLLELMANKSWNLLEHMMQRRGYSIRTSTAQMQVIGKRHYGLKALPRGGGGGRQVTRELFDTLLFWKATVPLDENGEASVTIPLSDSITGFVIVAIASAGQNLFGQGQTRIQTTQDIIIASGLPAMVRQGDRFKANFTVRNTTRASIDAEIKANMKDNRSTRELPAITEIIEAGSAKEVGWDVSVPEYADNIIWDVTVRDKKGKGCDSMKVTQRVIPVTTVRVVQSTVARLDRDISMEIEEPRDAISGKGGIGVSLKPKISQETGAIIEYMRQYPFTCIEQKISKAISLDDGVMWKKIMAKLPSYLDSNGLVKYFPRQQAGSDTLTAYIISIAHEAGFAIPESTETLMEQGLKGFVNGRFLSINPIRTADLSLRKLSAIEALSRKRMAEPSMLDSISIEPELLPTSAIIDWLNILKRVVSIPEREKKFTEAGHILRSRLNLQGTIMSFSTEKTDNLWWLMTGVDTNAIRTVLTFIDDPKWNEDMPRLIRGMIGRQQAGRWQTTVDNAWGMLTLKKFSKLYETEHIKGKSTVNVNAVQKIMDWDKTKSEDNFLFNWQKGRGTVSISHTGSGSPWVFVQSTAAIPRKSPVSTGFKIKKVSRAIEQRQKGVLSVGDVMRIRLELEAQADMTWVVVSDPIPAGSKIIRGGYGRGSDILSSDEKTNDTLYPVFEEHSFEAFRAYYSFVPKGRWSVEYTVRLNNEGVFKIPETRTEALYAPEMFGEIPNEPFTVRGGKP